MLYFNIIFNFSTFIPFYFDFNPKTIISLKQQKAIKLKPNH